MINKIRTLNVLPRWIIAVIDLIIFATSALIGYLLRLNFEINALYEFDFLRGIGIFTIAGLVATLLTRSYAGIIRYTGIQDALRVSNANLIVLVILFLINYLSENVFPYSIALISFFVSLVLTITYRLLVKELFAYYRTIPTTQKKIVILGAGQMGIMTKDLLENDRNSNFKVVAFLEDNERKVGKTIGGVKIYSAKQELKAIIEKFDPAEIIIASPNITIGRKNDLVDYCLKYKIQVKAVPSSEMLIDGRFDVKEIREINIVDLLGRDVISLNNKFIDKEISGSVVLITGAAGSIGAELARQVLNYGPDKLILFDQAETGLFEIENELRQLKDVGGGLVSFLGDLTNRNRLRQCMSQFKPHLILHAAAYKHVPLVELNVVEAIKTNIIGTQYIADLAIEFGVRKFIYISTDKAVNPTNVMGATKRAAEIYVQSLNAQLRASNESNTQFITTRFGNVLGSSGSVIPIFKTQIMRGGPVTVTHPEVTRYFMTIPEACSLVLEAGAMGEGGEVFVFDMGEPIKILDLARRMIQISGLVEGVDINIRFTGLRPGEKLFEEPLGQSERDLKTYHPKIMIVEPQKLNFTEVIEILNHLKDNLKNENIDEMLLVKDLKSLVEDYKSNQSPYEILDKAII